MLAFCRSRQLHDLQSAALRKSSNFSMLRITRVLLCISTVLAAWIAALYAGLPQITHQVVLWAPFAAVVAFGLYSIAAVLYGVFTFRDCPEEAASLRKDIDLARADLIKKGVLQA